MYTCSMLGNHSIFSVSLSLSFFFEMSINLRLYYSRDCRKISRLPFSISWLEVCRRAQWLSSHLQGTQRSDELEGASVPWSLLNLYKHETLLKFHHGMLFRLYRGISSKHPTICESVELLASLGLEWPDCSLWRFHQVVGRRSSSTWAGVK